MQVPLRNIVRLRSLQLYQNRFSRAKRGVLNQFCTGFDERALHFRHNVLHECNLVGMT